MKRLALGVLAVSLAIAGAIGVALLGPPPETRAVEHEPLPKADQELLWDAEHHGLELVNSGWKPLLAGLASGDRSTVSVHLDESFVARIPDAWEWSGLEATGLVTRKGQGSAAATELTNDGFLDWLFEWRQPFAGEPHTKFKITGIYPQDRENLSGDWLGSGRITVEGLTASGSPRFQIASITFRTVQPTKAALAQPGWLREFAVTQWQWGESSDFLMREVAVARGLDPNRLHDNWQVERPQVNSGGIYCCDYNRDGCVDVLVADIADERGLILYRNSPEGRFEDVSAAVNLPILSNAVDAIFADLNDDGWEDLVVPGYLVLQNVEGKRFVDVTLASNLDDLIFAWGLEGGMDSISGVSVADFNRDGLVDLYVTRADAANYKQGSWIDGASGDQYGCQLLQNVGGWTFVDRTFDLNADGGERSVFTSVWLDANNDDLPDVYVIHEFGPGVLLLNRDGHPFRAVELAAESSDFGSMGLTCGDVDNDGLIDLYVSNMYSSAGNRVMDNLPPGFYDSTIMGKLRRMVAGNQLHRNMGDLQFQAVGQEWGVQQVGWGWGPSLADLNNDGWLDIYATCGFMSRDRQKPDG